VVSEGLSTYRTTGKIMQKWDVLQFIRRMGWGPLPCVEVHETASVEHQAELERILANWQEGDVLVCFSPDRCADSLQLKVCVFRVVNAECSLLHDMVLRDVDVNCVDVHCVDCGGVKLQSPASDEIVQHINMLQALSIQSEHEAKLQYPPLQLQSLPSYGQIPDKAGAIKELYEGWRRATSFSLIFFLLFSYLSLTRHLHTSYFKTSLPNDSLSDPIEEFEYDGVTYLTSVE
jgi:hypothetical protein